MLFSFISEIGGSLEQVCYSAAVHLVLAVAVFRADVASLLFLPFLAFSATRDTAERTLLPLLILVAFVANTQPLKWVIGLSAVTVAWFIVASASGVFELSAGIITLLPILAGVALQGTVLRLTVLQRRVEQRKLADTMVSLNTARTEERRRLAGELHDIVAHDLTILTMLSTVGQTLDDAEKVKDNFSRMESTSRSALADLRRLLGVLERTEAPPLSVDMATTRPDIRAVVDAGIEDLTRLGFHTSLTCTGELETIPWSIQHGLRRSINEMLANVVKYAEPGGPVDIKLTLTSDEVALRIVNVPSWMDRRDGPGGVGLGLNHLQEQAESFNGSFRAGLNGHRWVSEISIPL